MAEKLFSKANLRTLSNLDLYEAGITAVSRRDTARGLALASLAGGGGLFFVGLGYDNYDATPTAVTTTLKVTSVLFGGLIAGEELVRSGVNHLRLRRVQKELRRRELRAKTTDIKVLALPHGLRSVDNTKPVPATTK